MKIGTETELCMSSDRDGQCEVVLSRDFGADDVTVRPTFVCIGCLVCVEYMPSYLAKLKLFITLHLLLLHVKRSRAALS